MGVDEGNIRVVTVIVEMITENRPISIPTRGAFLQVAIILNLWLHWTKIVGL